MTAVTRTDPATAADRRRLRAARAEARRRIREAMRRCGDARREAFREEMGATIRSASPFLISLAASQGCSLDDLAERLEPSSRWPRSPAVYRDDCAKLRHVRDIHRHYLVHTASGWTKAVRLRANGHGMTFMRSADDWAHLQVIDHSLEVECQIGPVKFVTLFGELRIELDLRIPATLAEACVGRAASTIIDHAALRRRGWPIVAVEDPEPAVLGQTLIVATNAAAYRMPWAR